MTLRSIRIEGEEAYVPLTQGYEAIIDAADVPLVEGFSWRVMKGRHTHYAAAWGPRLNGERQTVLMHRVILGIEGGTLADHEDRNGLNNRRKNLRPATYQENAWNSKCASTSGTGLKGSSFCPRDGNYQAYITVQGKKKNLGKHPTAELAHAAYKVAAFALHGEFARPS